MDLAVEHLTEDDRHPSGRTVLVRGDSGTGKTFLSRELMRRLGQECPNSLFLYIDVADDEYQSSRTLAALLRMALVPGPMTETSVVNVPEPLSLARYRKRMRNQGMGRGAFRALAQAVGAFLGFGNAVGAALEFVDDEAAALEDELAAYLAWVAKQGPVFIAIDNLQFLNLEVRLTIESVLQRVDRTVRLIAVDRTVDDISELDPEVRCFGDRLMQLRLGTLTATETRRLVEAVLGDGDDSSRLSEDIFTKTGGLAKDIDYCLRQYVLELGQGAQATAIDGLLVTIDRLPLIHRQFLVIATLLNGGLKKEIAQRAVRRLSALYEDSNLDRGSR
jgi:Cdc6-like AAA superfamily ATPase